MNTYEYRRACSYARKLTENYRDIVHDAYLDYYYRMGEDLFDAPNQTIIVTVRNHYYNSVRRNRFMYRGEYFQKRYYSLNNDVSLQEGSTQQEYLENKFNLHNNTDLDSLIIKDQVEYLSKELTLNQSSLLKDLVDGHTIMDLAEIKGLNQSSVRRVHSRIKEKAETLTELK